MTNAIPRHLANRHTRYEIAATGPAGQRAVVGFTSRVSRGGLLAAMRARGQELIDFCGIGDDLMTFACKPRVHALVAGWTIGFTGRTELEAGR